MGWEIGALKAEFIIPFLPPSMNSLYGITNRGGKVRVFLKHEGRRFKDQAKLHMPPRTLSSSLLLVLDIEAHGRWHCKNGEVKKKDVTNLDKVLVDAIAEKYLDGNDQRVWVRTIGKVEDEEESLTVRIYEYGKKGN